MPRLGLDAGALNDELEDAEHLGVRVRVRLRVRVRVRVRVGG